MKQLIAGDVIDLFLANSCPCRADEFTANESPPPTFRRQQKKFIFYIFYSDVELPDSGKRRFLPSSPWPPGGFLSVSWLVSQVKYYFFSRLEAGLALNATLPFSTSLIWPIRNNFLSFKSILQVGYPSWLYQVSNVCRTRDTTKYHERTIISNVIIRRP